MTSTDAYLVLNLLPGIGPVKVARLLRSFGSPEAVLSKNFDQLVRVSGCGPESARVIAAWPDSVDLEREHRRIREIGATVVTPADDDYPETLRQMIDAPRVLYVMGKLTPPTARGIAVVGSRRATNYGIQAARRLSFQIASAGMTVISGLARGIDTAAHEGALAANGRTIAVIGSGLGQLYPPENRALAERIAESGAVVSEFPIDYPPDKQSFPLRNRIVAAWALGTLVVEAPARSGALITANQALDYGRNVYAVPGPIDRPSSQGANRLIQDGARLVMDGADILDDLTQLIPPRRTVRSDQTTPLEESPSPRAPSTDTSGAQLPPQTIRGSTQPDLTAAEQILLELLHDQETHIDDLIASSGFAGHVVLSNLTRLEMKRLARQLPGKQFVRGPAA